ncbi:NADP-dependent oxidoreductase [Nonomuraea sp. NPDC050556]|uniref:NADP-dependent oxidoreductase n=1 Tax=Nonomuraea sp. NPDC050556 TaxID=3364369 RepID=UPI00379C00C2
MRAITVSGFGATPELTDQPTPTPGPGQVLVRMRAAGFNPFDLKIVDGALKDAVEHRFPLVMGVDGAGVVEAVGSGVSRFKAGDNVYGQFSDPAHGMGSYAEYAVASEDGALSRMPEGMIFSQAAGVPTSTMTAYNLVETARVDEGQTVLVVGATGGVGQSATQFAANRGARVIATARDAQAAMMHDLGAAETIDYTQGAVPSQVLAVHQGGIDTIIDLVTPPGGIDALANLLKPGGLIISSIWSVNGDALAARELRGLNFENTASGELLATLADLIDGGKLKVHLESEPTLAEAPAVLEKVKNGGARGKTVFRI